MKSGRGLPEDRRAPRLPSPFPRSPRKRARPLPQKRRLAGRRNLHEETEQLRASLQQALEHKKRYESVLQLLLDLGQQSAAMTDEVLGRRAVEIAIAVTKSRSGCLRRAGDINGTTPRDARPARVSGTGASKSGQGLGAMQRRIDEPIMEDGTVREFIEVADKASDYDDEDRRQLMLVAAILSKIRVRRRAEAALKESEARFRFITDLSPGLIWVTDTEKHCTWFNRTWLDFTGRTLGQESGDGWLEGVHSDDVGAYVAAAEKSVDAQQPFEAEYRLRRHDGEYRWMLSFGQPRFDDDGHFKGYVGTCIDITEHKRTNEAIRESKSLLQNVIDATPDWIYVTDGEHRFMLVNRQCARDLGQTPTGMIGHRERDFIPLDQRDCEGGENGRPIQDGGDIERFPDNGDDVFSGRTVHHPCEKIRFDDGRTRVFDLFKFPLRDSMQRIYGVLCYRRDITEHVSKELEQKALETQLRQAQKMELIGHLTGGIAHDFNNILAAVFGYAELMQMSPVIERNEPLAAYLHEILQAGIRAKELVSQLLTFSHRREATGEAIDIAPIITEVAKLLRSTMPTSISIDYAVAKRLPKALISPVQLHQVLMNLGVNARDAMGETGAVSIRADMAFLAEPIVCASCHQSFSGRFLAIAVSDTGTGITTENMTRIFDPFFTTKAVGRGSGLGLSVLHGIVHSADGHIRVDSLPGEGTEFHIYLPPHESEPRRFPRDPTAELQTPVRGHVMVVDDEESIVRFMTVLMENLGCRVTGLTSPREALRLFENAPGDIDLVMTDQTMPELSGVELARAMLARRPDIPIILSTGYSNAVDEDMARQLGIVRFLMKPVPAKVLADLVTEYLADKSTDRTRR